MNNFEWAAGYGQRFGLAYVDLANGAARMRKDFLRWYADVIHANRVIASSA